ncbi:MAG: TonB-dependent receptor family protein, partial [Wenzhouxiangella sp.]
GLSVLLLVGSGFAAQAVEDASDSENATPAEDSRTAADGDGAPQDRVSVTVTRLDRELLDAPAAISRLGEQALQTARQQLQLDETLSRVPGVFFQNRYNFAQNQRLAIRGFGARSPFGIRGIRLLVDGFPETLPDGQAQVDGIDLESVTQAEVLRGPSSALHGNASGGVISLRTQDGRGLAPEVQLRTTAGSYGFERYGIRAGGQFEDWNAYLSAWDLSYDGYREQSRTDKRLLNAHLGRQLDGDRRIGLVLTMLDQPRGEDPSALTRQQAEADRRGAGGQALQVDARQVVEQYRLGLRYEDAASLPGELSAYAFVAGRDFFQQLPSSFFPSLIEFDRDFWGGGAQYVDALRFGSLPARYTLGLDLARQRDDRRRFTVSPSGQRRDQTQDELQQADNAGLFGQIELDLSRRWSALVGLRHDRIELDIDDRFGDGSDNRSDNRSGSARRSFDEASWTAGLNYRIGPDRQLYFNAGTAFETPTFTEIKDAAGGVGFSRAIEPQRARNLEIGFRGRWGERLSLDVAAFRVNTRDEIIVVASEDGLNLFDNAGRTRRDGVELALEHALGGGLALSAAYTWSRFRFEEFRDAGQRFDGKRMPGLPEHLLFAELAWRGETGLYAVVDTLAVSEVYADNANAERVAGYGLVNARLGRLFELGPRRLEVFVALNNLTDRRYFSNIRVNAARGAYYEPAPERNLFAGLRLGL